MQLLGLRSWVFQISGSFSDVMSLTFSLQLHHSKGVVFHTPTVCNVIKSAMATQWIGWNKVYFKGPVCRNWEGLLADTECNTHVSVFSSIQSTKTKTNCCALISFKRPYQQGVRVISHVSTVTRIGQTNHYVCRKSFPHTLKSSSKVRAGYSVSCKMQPHHNMPPSILHIGFSTALNRFLYYKRKYTNLET